MALKSFNSLAGYSVGNTGATTVIDSVGNVSANFLAVTSNSNLGNYATANFFSGDGGLLTNISATTSNAIANGTSNVRIPAASGNINLSVGGTSNVLVVTGTGVNVAGTLGTSGNTTVSNLIANTNIFTPSITTSATNGNLTIDPNGSGNLVISSTTPMVVANSGTATSPALQLTGSLSTSANYGLLHIGTQAATTNANVPLWINQSANATIRTVFTNPNTQTNAGISYEMELGGATPSDYSFISLTRNNFSIEASRNFYLTSGLDGGGIVGNMSLSSWNDVTITAGDRGITGTGNIVFGTVYGTQVTLLGDANGTMEVNGYANFFNPVQVNALFTATNISTGTLANSTSNIRIFSAGNVTTSVGGTANVLVVTSTGANITGTLNATGNANTGNIGATNGVFTNISGTLTGTLANGTSNVAIPTASGNVNITAGGTTTLVVTSTSVNVAGILNATGNIIASSLYPISNNSGELGNSAFRWGSAYITAPTVQSMTATNRIALSSNAELRLGSSVDNNAAMYYNTGNGLFELRMGPTSANFQITNNGTPGFTFDRATSNLTTTGNITATGNIAGNVFIGNGSQLTGISATTLANGTSNVAIPTASGNVNTSVGGVSNVLVVTTTGANITGTLETSGNTTVSNLIANTNIFTPSITTSATNGNLTIDPNGSGNLVISSTTPTVLANSGTANIAAGLQLTGTLLSGTSNYGLLHLGTTAPYQDSNVPLWVNYSANDVIHINYTNPNTGNNTSISTFWALDSATANYGYLDVSRTSTTLGSGKTLILTTDTVGNIDLISSSNINFQTQAASPLTLYGGNGTASFSGNIIAQSFANGNSNIRVIANSNVVISAIGNANIFTVTGTGVNVSGTLNATGNANTGNIGATTGVFTNISGTLTGTLANGTSNINIVNNANINMVRSGTTRLVVTNSGVNVTGAFSATSKSFLIQHPINPEMHLQYGSLESPYHGVRLTGEAIVKKGKCVIILPDYIRGLIKQEGAQVQLTNYQHGRTLYVDSINVDENMFIVKSNWKLSELKFFWSFTGIRKDVEDLVVEY